jgi:hypothetical protein
MQHVSGRKPVSSMCRNLEAHAGACRQCEPCNLA